MAEFPKSIDAGLLRVDPDHGVTLLAGRRANGQIVFPQPQGDSSCKEIALPREGILWSWTVQRFRPKSPPYAGPAAFEPYAVGYVDLGNVIVETRLVGAVDGFRIGMPMVLVAEPFALDASSPRVTFAFKPTGAKA